MNINIDDYPSLIAVPYKKTLSESIQQKEYQRICLEMILSFNAIVCLSNYFALKKSGGGEKLKNLDLDLGQMSIGKWNAISRATSKNLNEGAKEMFVNEIYELYHGARKNDWNSAVDELISRRNKDAHGEVISASQLPEELKQRQQKLDKLMELLSFYRDFHLLLPYEDEIKEGKFAYICKAFRGDEEHIESITGSVDELDKYRPYLFNVSSGKSLALSPMVVVYPQSEEARDMSIFVYSKTLNKKTGDLHFSNWDSSKDFAAQEKDAPGDFFAPDQICKEFKSFRVYVEDESLVYQQQPSFTIERKFKDSILSKGEIAGLSVSIKNDGDADAEDVKAIFDFPREGFVRIDSDEKELEQDVIEINIPFLEQGNSWEKEYYFRSKDSGQYEFATLALFYSYLNLKNELVEHDDKKGIINTESSPALLYEVFDPSDPESQIPIININMSYDHDTTQIGEKVTLNIDVKNIGRSVANDVKISILPPKDQMELLSGSPDWRGTLNPDQSVKSQFILLPKTHGVFTMKMRDIVYRNQRGELFKTLAYEDYKILVRNNPKVQYRFLMEEIWNDLVLDADEQYRVELFARQHDITPEEKQDIESEVKIKIIKNIVKDIADRGGWKVREKVRDSKAERMHAFCLGPCPFLVIDFFDMQNIKLLVRGNFKGPQFINQNISWHGRFRELAFTMLSLSELGSIGGSNRLKGMINQSMRWVEQRDYLLVLLADDLADMLHINRESIDIVLEGGYIAYKFSPEIENDLVVNGCYTYFDAKNRANIVASYPQSAHIGSNLKEAEYKFAKKNDLSSEQPFEISDRVTTFVHVDSQKIDKHNRADLINKLPDFVLTCIDLAYEQLQTEFKEGQEARNCLAFIDQTVSKHIKDFICKIDQKKNIITYHAGREFPIFKPGSDFLQVSIKKNKVIMAFRIMNREIYEDLGDNVDVENDYWPYEVDFNEDIKDLLVKAIVYGVRYIDKEFQELSYGILKATLENMWVSNFGLLLKELVSKKEITFKEGDQLLQEENSKTKINNVARGINTFFKNRKIESPIDTNYTDENISLKEKYHDLVNSSIENYKLKIDDDVMAFHDFKQLLNKLNENRASMSYLSSMAKPITIISTDNFKHNKGIYINVTLQKNIVRISLSITKNPYSHEVKDHHENLLSQGIRHINEKEIILGSVKDGKEDSYKISLELLLGDIGQMKDKDWVNNFVDTFNEFAKIFLAKDYEQLKLNYYTS